MKKSIYYLIAAAIFSGVFPGTVSADTVPKALETETLLFADFDSETADFSFRTSGENVISASAIKDSGLPDAGGVLALKRESSAEGGVYAELTLGKAKMDQGIYRISYDVQTDMTDQWAPYIILGAGEQNTKLSVIGADSSAVLCSYAKAPNAGGWWACHEHDPEEKVTMTANVWTNVQILLNMKQSTADYYYNNIHVGQQTSQMLGDTFANGIDRLRFELWSHGSFLPEIMIDNFKIEKILPSVQSVMLVDSSGKRIKAEGNVQAVSNTIEISVENLSDPQEFSKSLELWNGSEAVDFTSTYHANTKRYTLYLQNPLENGASFTLKALGKEFYFTVNYGEKTFISKLSLKPLLGNDELTNLDSVTANTPLKIETTVVNPKGESGSYDLIAACFDGDRMVSARAKRITFGEALISSGSLPFAAPGAEHLRIEAYAYQNMENLIPLSDGFCLGENGEENEYSVSVTGEKSGERAVLCIFAPEMSEKDLILSEKPTDVSDVIGFISQKIVSESGEVSFSVKLPEDGKSGAYTGALHVGANLYPQRLIFVNREENRSAMSMIKTSENRVSDAKKNHSALGFGSYTENVPEDAYRVFADALQDAEIDETAYEENLLIVHRAEFLACLNDGQISSLFSDPSVLAAEFAEIQRYFQESYFTKALQDNITKRCQAKHVQTLKALKPAVEEAFVLAVVEAPNGYKNITPLLKAFRAEIGISESDANDTAASKIAGKNFLDFAALKMAIKNANTSSSSSSSASSSSGSKKETSNAITSPGVIKTEPVSELPKTIYTDLSEEHWAADAVVGLTEKGILNGRADGRFDPNAAITREEFTKMIVTAFLDEDEQNGEDLPFLDVQKGAWYDPFLRTAYQFGLISGMSETYFGVGENITRQDAAVILNRAAKNNHYNFNIPDSIIHFEDDADIAEYAIDAVYTLKEAGVLRGDGGYFYPKHLTTRAEAAVLIYSLLSM